MILSPISESEDCALLDRGQYPRVWRRRGMLTGEDWLAGRETSKVKSSSKGKKNPKVTNKLGFV